MFKFVTPHAIANVIAINEAKEEREKKEESKPDKSNEKSK
jgi:hypothetical protein